MASLRLKFPEKDEPSVIVLTGSRVTLGRLPLNTIQIIDRTLSGFHAEFVLEEDHYRLHDRGSTNGTFVNGEPVTDFHLREACKVAFGALECEYSPETPAPAEAANVEALPTRSEINAVRQENAELKNRVGALREEVEALNKAHGAESSAGTVAVKQEEYDQLLAEREALKEAQHAAQQEIAKLKTDLALLRRDRENLKLVAASAQAEFANFRAEPAGGPAVETPKPVAEKPEPAKVEAAPLPPPAATPAAVPLPKPSFPLPVAAKLAPKPPGALPTKQPVPVGSGVRPTPVAVPAKQVTAPAAAPSPKPTVRLPTTPAPAPKGSTQRIDTDAATKPIAPAPKVPLKPPMKLPLQPTVKLQPGTPLPRTVSPLKGGANGPSDKGSGQS
ncbi:MAG: FHA domain-containing protein [Chthoniobacteraceae bacterium]